MLTEIVKPERRRQLLKLTSYYRCTQHAHKPYMWDGAIAGYEAPYYVFATEEPPMAQRQPSQRLDLGKIIVDRLTSFVFGFEHFPAIKVEGDPLAQDFARELAKEAALPVRMIEARNLGGAAGSVALSWGFVNGRPVVEVHVSAFVEVLEWADYERRKPGRVLKAYPYTVREWNREGRAVDVKYWYARYWDTEVDITWPQIPEALAKTKAWADAEHTLAQHNAGFCPVYWVQNLPDSSDVDGMSDYEGQEDCFDNADILLSATTRGTILNVDPTLVIMDDEINNEGPIRKGSHWAIHAKNAKYLEVSGSSVTAGLENVMKIRQFELDKASVVLLDPEKLAGAGVSAAALKTRFLPMLAKCDVLREQYGSNAIRAILEDMLKMARRLDTEPREDEDGALVMTRVKLAPKIEELDDRTNITERNPGTGEHVSLAWPPYFPASWQDRKEAVTTMKEGVGGQPVVSYETAVEALAPVLGVEDPRAELRRIEEDKEGNLDRAQRAFGAGAPRVPVQGDDERDQGGESDRETEGGGAEEA
jgi:hypothetical protein